MIEEREGWVESEVEVGSGEKSSPLSRSSRYQHHWLTAPRGFRSTKKVKYIAHFSCYSCLENYRIDPSVEVLSPSNGYTYNDRDLLILTVDLYHFISPSTKVQ